jgi:cation diffusion facilitator family transporter
MSHAHADPVTRAAEVRFVLIWILVANVAVVAAKLLIGLRTGSLAVFGDAMHSSVDSINNLLALVVISVAARGPDEEHPYGHQKFETLGALAIVGFLSVTGFELVKGAVQKLITGAPPLHVSGVQITILVGTLLVNVAVATYESHKGRQLDSEILLADATHTKADVFVTLGVLAGVSLSLAGFGWADPIVALAVAVVIIVLAWGILARSVPVLVDKHAIPAEELRLSAEAIDGVRSAYSIRSRGSRYHYFAELTIAVDCDVSVEVAHRAADAVEAQLRSQFGFYEITVHIEPC